MNNNFDKKTKEIVDSIGKAAEKGDLRRVESACNDLTQFIKENLTRFPESFADRLEAMPQNAYHEREKMIGDMILALREDKANLSPSSARMILKILRNKRDFGLLAKLGDVVISMGSLDRGADSLSIRLYMAQAMIESGFANAALEWLADIQGRIDKKSRSQKKKLLESIAECAGLQGRAYKELYKCNAESNSERAAKFLNKSISQYACIYFDPDFEKYADRTWHGINLATLLSIAHQKEITVRMKPKVTSREIAEQVLAIIDGRKKRKKALEWDSGTALEASLLIGKKQDALNKTLQYIRRQLDSFYYGSTYRQLVEILEINPENEINARILSMLHAMQLRSGEGAPVELKEIQQESAVINELTTHFEATFDQTEYKTLEWYKKGLICARSVGKISTKLNRAHGTGFLVRGVDVDNRLSEELVLLTNSHVISDDLGEQTGPDPRSLEPGNAEVVFHAVDSNKKYGFKEIHRNSHRNELDFSIMLFEDGNHPVGIEPLQIAPRPPIESQDQRAYLIGHPKGEGLSFSLQNNRIHDYEASDGIKQKVSYRAPTETGSSGSPVFNEEWKVFALHHASYSDANWAILMSRISNHESSGS